MFRASAAVMAVAVLGAVAALALGMLPLALVLAGLAVVSAVVRLAAARRRVPAPQPARQALAAQTDHVVELYQVNSAPGEEEIENFMYAQCGEEGCEFLEFADPDAADQEASLRSKVAVHSLKQSPVIQIYV
jgi:hypothetical protein